MTTLMPIPVGVSVLTKVDKHVYKRHFELRPGAGSSSLRIGRGAKNEISVQLNGISTLHAEIRLVENSQLVIIDLSTNGTVLRPPGGKSQVLKRGVEVPLPHGSLLLCPANTKTKEGEKEDRGQIKVELDKPETDSRDSRKRRQSEDKAAHRPRKLEPQRTRTVSIDRGKENRRSQRTRQDVGDREATGGRERRSQLLTPPKIANEGSRGPTTNTTGNSLEPCGEATTMSLGSPRRHMQEQTPIMPDTHMPGSVPVVGSARSSVPLMGTVRAQNLPHAWLERPAADLAPGTAAITGNSAAQASTATLGQLFAPPNAGALAPPLFNPAPAVIPRDETGLSNNDQQLLQSLIPPLQPPAQQAVGQPPPIPQMAMPHPAESLFFQKDENRPSDSILAARAILMQSAISMTPQPPPMMSYPAIATPFAEAAHTVPSVPLAVSLSPPRSPLEAPALSASHIAPLPPPAKAPFQLGYGSYSATQASQPDSRSFGTTSKASMALLAAQAPPPSQPKRPSALLRPTVRRPPPPPPTPLFEETPQEAITVAFTHEEFHDGIADSANADLGQEEESQDRGSMMDFVAGVLEAIGEGSPKQKPVSEPIIVNSPSSPSDEDFQAIQNEIMLDLSPSHANGLEGASVPAAAPRVGGVLMASQLWGKARTPASIAKAPPVMAAPVSPSALHRSRSRTRADRPASRATIVKSAPSKPKPKPPSKPPPQSLLRPTRLAPSAREGETLNETYSIILQKTDSVTKLGVDIRKSSEGLLITADRGAGLVKVWNDEHPELLVATGHIIFSVNGVSGNADQLLDEIRTGQQLRIMLRRGAAGEAAEKSPL